MNRGLDDISVDLVAKSSRRAGRLPSKAVLMLREAILTGRGERRRLETLTGAGERRARMIASTLAQHGILTATTHRAPLRLAFPLRVVERWFPALYPQSSPQLHQINRYHISR